MPQESFGKVRPNPVGRINVLVAKSSFKAARYSLPHLGVQGALGSQEFGALLDGQRLEVAYLYLCRLNCNCGGVGGCLQEAADGNRYVVDRRSLFMAILDVVIDMGRAAVDQLGVNSSCAGSCVIVGVVGPIVPVEGCWRSSIEFVKNDVEDLPSSDFSMENG